MSQLLRLNSDFLSLLLSPENKKQQQVLMNTLSEIQCDCLNELFYNVSNCCELRSEQIKRLSKDVKLIKALSDTSKVRKKRKAALKRHQKDVIRILTYLAPQLQQVVDYSVSHGR